MSTTGSILLVDDEEKILKTLGRALGARGTASSKAPMHVRRSGCSPIPSTC